MREVDTRHVPYDLAEVEWARHRPRRHRTPIPAVGDTVLYRHSEWADPVDADVIYVQPADDLTDPNLWQVQRDSTGAVAVVDGRPVVSGHVDPWVSLTLRTRYGTVITREARLRGSPGWLPVDWERRERPVPGVVPTGRGSGSDLVRAAPGAPRGDAFDG